MFPLSRLQLSLIAGLIVMAAIIWGLISFRNDAIRFGIAKDARRTAPIIAGLRTDLKQCRANTDELTGKIDAANAEIDAAKREGDRKAKALADELKIARKAAATSDARADKLERYRARGADLCARMIDADRQIMETVR